MPMKDEPVERRRLAEITVTVALLIAGGGFLVACGSSESSESVDSATGLADLTNFAPVGYTATGAGPTTVTPELVAKATPGTDGLQVWPQECAGVLQSSAPSQVGSKVQTVTFTGEGQVIVVGLQTLTQPRPTAEGDVGRCDTGSFRAAAGEGFFRGQDPIDLGAGIAAKGRQVISLSPGGEQQSTSSSYVADLDETTVLTLAVVPDVSAPSPRLVVDAEPGIELYRQAAELVRPG